MDITAQYARVLASLIEKAETTPDHYPLSTKALQAACNQSNNRDPVVDYSERDVDALMLELREAGLARTVTGTGHRVGKHKHVVDVALGLDGHELAVLAALLLRGAQTLNQLTTRTSRYACGPAGDAAAVDAAIDRLAARSEPLVRRVERRPGEREPRVAQCWADTNEISEISEISGDDATQPEDRTSVTPHRAGPRDTDQSAVGTAREFWQRIETLHAVTYFGQESVDAAADAGLRGFWMGYFGLRAAPLGAVDAGVVEALFANFAPSMVHRALPDAWKHARPDVLVVTRAEAAAATLRRVCPGIDAAAPEVNATLGAVVERGQSVGRPMFAANREVGTFDDPVAQLWQHCTTLREHRGDGHLIALATSRIDGCEAHRLLLAEQQLPPEVLRDNRGWSIDEWADAASRLRHRGLLATVSRNDESGNDIGTLTDAGRRLRTEVEALTDSLAAAPFAEALGAPDTSRLLDALTVPARTVARSGVIPFPNPMGLTQLGE